MDITIVATRGCNHRAMIENQLETLGASYKIAFLDDHPELIQKYDIHSSPNILVDEEVVFRATSERSMPTVAELEQFLKEE